MRALIRSLLVVFAVTTACRSHATIGLFCSQKTEAQNHVVVVDAESSGARTPKLLKADGYVVFHIRTHEGTYPPNEFALDLRYDGTNFAGMVATLKALGVAAVIPGSEAAVELTNRLHVALGLPSNDPEKFDVLQDKYLQQELLRAAGLPSIPQMKTSDKTGDAALAWIAERERYHLGRGRSRTRAWPVVIRPFNSSGSDGLYVCHNEAEVRAACQALIGTSTKRGRAITEVLLQEYIPGREYAVGIELVDGDALGSLYFEYEKTRVPRPDGGFSEMYDHDVMLSFDASVVARLEELSIRMARVFGHRNGSAHPEFKITPEGEIYLIEWNARAMGGINAELVAAAVGIGPIELGIESHLHRQRLRERIQRREKPKLEGEAWIVQFNCRRAGTLIGLPYWDRLKEFPLLKSPNAVSFKYQPGDKIPVTVDLKSSPGEMAWLIRDADRARARAEMRRALELFRQWEREGFYELAEDVVAPLEALLLAVGDPVHPSRGRELADALLALMAHRAFRDARLKGILIDVLVRELTARFAAEGGTALRDRIRQALPGLLVEECVRSEDAVGVWETILSRARLYRERP